MIGKLVKKQRAKKGYTQKELAERIGVTHAAISKLEKQNLASKQILIAVARELESDFGVNFLKKHFEKFPSHQLSPEALLAEGIRGIVREELNKDRVFLRKVYTEAKTKKFTKQKEAKNKKEN